MGSDEIELSRSSRGITGNSGSPVATVRVSVDLQRYQKQSNYQLQNSMQSIKRSDNDYCEKPGWERFKISLSKGKGFPVVRLKNSMLPIHATNALLLAAVCSYYIRWFGVWAYIHSSSPWSDRYQCSISFHFNPLSIPISSTHQKIKI